MSHTEDQKNQCPLCRKKACFKRQSETTEKGYGLIGWIIYCGCPEPVRFCSYLNLTKETAHANWEIFIKKQFANQLRTSRCRQHAATKTLWLENPENSKEAFSIPPPPEFSEWLLKHKHRFSENLQQIALTAIANKI